MKNSRLGMYSLAIGVLAVAITGCGSKNDTSEAPANAPAANAPAGKAIEISASAKSIRRIIEASGEGAGDVLR